MVSSILNHPKPLEPSSLISESKSSICFRVSNSFVCKALTDPCEDKISLRKLIDVSVKISVISNIFSSMGVKKIRLTGGEPLLRKNIQPRLAWEITFLKISMENL